jgi:hypothetical protein
MSPVLKWGLGVGLVIVVVDTLSVFATRRVGPESDAAQYIALVDQFANVLLLSVMGRRVVLLVGIVRAAAEAGVLAGAVAGFAAIAVTAVFPQAGIPPSTREMIGTLAFNVAMGGIVALISAFIATRAQASRAGRSGR